MKRITTIYLLLLALLPGLTASAQTVVFTSKSMTITFFSEAPLENIEAITKNGTSVLTTSKNEVVFLVPIKSFTFDKSLMQEHFNENYMESNKYPNATFKGIINEAIDYKMNGTHKVSVTGKLNVHGVDRDRTINGFVTIKDGIISISSDFVIECKEHDIKIPNLLAEKIAEKVMVKVSGSYAPYVKAEKSSK